MKIRLFATNLILVTALCLSPSLAADTPKKAARPAAIFTLPASQLVRVGDIDINYRMIGEGHPTILITGYGCAMDQWDHTLLKVLSSRYKVIIFENRGIGKTTASDKPFSVELFAQDTVGLMDALKIPKAHIMGFSMGAFIAQEIVLRHPARVSKLVLYAGNCGWEGKDIVKARPEDFAALMDLSGTKEERSKRLVSVLFPEKFIEDHPDFLKNLPVSESVVPLSTMERQGQAMSRWSGVCDKIGTIKNSTLIITGTEDAVIPPANSLMMAHRIPNSWLIRIPGGHSTMYQYPETFSRSVLTFLDAD